MGFFSALAKAGKSALGVASDVGTAALGTIIGDEAAEAIQGVSPLGLASGGGSGGLTAPPALPGMDDYPVATPGFNPNPTRGVNFTSGGPAGVALAPQGVYYQPIEGQNVRKVFRCMPGYVMVNYPPGTTSRVCMLKNYARSMGLWKPSKKPPISVRDWSALSRADSVIRKLKKVDSRAKRIGNYRTPTRRSKAVDASYTVIDEGKGSANLKVIKAGKR